VTNDERSRGRKSPTKAELDAWRTYIESAEVLRRTLAAGLQESSGISPGDYAVLLALDEADDHRLRSSALADAVGWERSRLSHHLRRMEERGLVSRSRGGADSRAADCELTEAGASLFRSSSASHLRLVRELFVDALTPAQLGAAHEVATRLREHLEPRSTPVTDA
jgi:DNA-binding MarR family transcriptional regulator